MKLYHYRARVVRVVDADTLECSIDTGFGIHFQAHVRLLGIDAFETRTKDAAEKRRGLEVKQKLIEFLSRYQYIYVKTSFDRTFSRWLGEVFLDEGYTYCINKEISDWMGAINVRDNNNNIHPGGSI